MQDLTVLSGWDDMVKSLKKNDALDFHLYLKQKAKKGFEKWRLLYDYHFRVIYPKGS